MATFIFDCPHCGTKQLGFDLMYANYRPASGQWQGFSVCQICDRSIALAIVGPHTINPANMKANLSPSFHITDSWPQSEEHTAPDYVPGNVAKAFEEGARSLRNASPNAAAAMFRRSIDIGLKVIAPDLTTKVMGHRIDQLAKDGRLTKDLAAWAHQVKIDGNEALHEIDEFDTKAAGDLESFTEMLLTYLFTMPGRVKKKMTDAGHAPES